mgnify:CR=1 FL=1
MRQVRAERRSVDVGELGVDLRAQGRRREQEDVGEGEGERGSSKSAVQDLRIDEKVKNEERKRDARPAEEPSHLHRVGELYQLLRP